MVVGVAVAEANRIAEDKQEEALRKAEVAFDKRLAAKMVDMMEANKVKTAQEVDIALRKVSGWLLRGLGGWRGWRLGMRNLLFVCVPVNAQAQIEHNAIAEEIQQEMHELVKTYERAVAEAETRRMLSEKRAEGYAGDLAVYRAKEDKNALLVDKLRKDVTREKLRLTIVFARSVTLLASASQSAQSAAKKGLDMASRMMLAEARVDTLLKMKTDVTDVLNAGRALYTADVSNAALSGLLWLVALCQHGGM